MGVGDQGVSEPVLDDAADAPDGASEVGVGDPLDEGACPSDVGASTCTGLAIEEGEAAPDAALLDDCGLAACAVEAEGE